MADDDYNTKLESLRRYIPFLSNMMAELKAKGNREAQYKKIKSLHDMITDTRKKLKLETLKRCEEVLTNIYFKVNPQLKSKDSLGSRMLPKIYSPRESSTLPGIESPRSTPASPSPPRDIVLTKPVNIPTEKIESSSFGVGSLSSKKSHRPKVDVYSNVVMNNPDKQDKSIIPAKTPDMSKPPISLDDLKTLEDDVQQKIDDATFANASVDDLQEVRKQLELQLRVDSISTSMGAETSHNENINTSSTSVSKKLTCSDDKSKPSTSSPTKETKSSILEKKSTKDKGSKDVSPHKPSQKVLKEDSSIFGHLLSSIDDKLLEIRKKVEKVPTKEDGGSNTSISSEKSDNKETELKTKSKDKHKHRRSSSEKHKHKTDKESKERSDSKSKDSKQDSSTKKHKKDKKEKHRSKEHRSKSRSSKDSKSRDDTLKTDKDKPKIMLLSDILLSNSKVSLESSQSRVASPCDSTAELNKNRLDAPKDTKSNADEIPSTLEETQSPQLTTQQDQQTQSTFDSSKPTTVYKRLADKYKPKPKTKPEADIPDVDKAVSDSIENFMKVSPVKPLLNSFGESTSSPGDRIFDTVKLQPKNTPIVAEQTPPVQLPDILQKIFSKPLLGDLIPKRLHENAIPLSMMSQNRQQNLNLTKPGALHPPEPPILSPPHRPVQFQPPDTAMRFSNFVSPPHRPEIRPNLEMGRPHALLPTPGAQHGFIPAPPIPPNLPRSFMEYNPIMNMGCGTPRMDFDTPSTPLPDFDSPHMEFEVPHHVRNDQFVTNQRLMPQERPINNCDPRTQKFNAQPQYQRPPEVNIFSSQMLPDMRYYGAQNPMAMLGPEVPLYMPDQAYYQERAWQESNRWGNNRRPGDPRNYKEYREMKERQEREAKAAQEKQKDIKDPRLAPRDGEKDVRDPRLMRENVDKREDKNDVSIRDPRLSRGNVEINKKEIKNTDLETTPSEKVPKEKESRFDKMYSQTNKGRSQSRTRPSEDKSDDDDSFTSPLDSLYKAGEKGKTGRGYGVQNFKIPRKSRVDDVRRRDEIKGKQKPSDNIGRKKRIVELSDESSESDTNEVDNSCPAENDSDVESVEEEKIEKNSTKTETKTNDATAKNKDQQLISKKPEVPIFYTSRIKVILNKDSKSDLNLWQSSNAEDDESDFSNFVSEYDLECQIENKNKILAEINDENLSKPKTQTKEPDIQLEEPSSSQDFAETKSVSPSKPQEKSVAADSSNKNDESCKEDATKMITQTVEADSSKTGDGILTPQGSVSKSEEPTEQKILAHFFENLLKSNNKKDKKTALFSLIETFSDSFETKEIEKIRKIIKVSDEEEESDGEDKESKSNTEKKDETTEIIQETKKVPDIQEDQAVVGSTTEEVSTKCTKHEDTEISTTQEIPETTVSLPNPELDAPIIEETKHEEFLIDQITNPEKGSSLEPVMVSVGERIKNRKRNSNPAKPRKKGKTELDLLHEDIQDMFIRDGVLTATGKRMCRILKDDPSVLSVDKPTTSPEQPKKGRKKPGPKPKAKSTKDEVQNSLKDMRIVIKKMPDDVIKSNMSNVRQLRSRIRLSSYAESDDDSLNSIDKDTISLRSRVVRNNYAESDDGQKSFAENETATTEDNDSIRSEIEGDITTESEEEDNKSQTSDGAQKRVLRRRRGTKWASGIIPKNKKKKLQQSKSIENSPVPSRAPSPEHKVDALEEAGFDKLVEPDKDYYYDFTKKTKLKCKLCKYSGHLLTGHYLKEHPQSEVLCARLAPEVAAEAIKDFELMGKKYENVINVKMTSKYQYCCRVCGFSSSTSPIFFYEHVTTHTGEYRHQCGICEYYAVTGKTMAGHFLSAHPEQEKKAIRRTYTLAIIFGYMCGGCNFMQLKEKSVKDHANIFHLNEKPTVYKINMSTVVDPVLNIFGSTVKEQKALEPILTDISMASNDSETPSENVSDSKTVEKVKRKKSCPKPKDSSKQDNLEEKKEENIKEKESYPITVKKKPGPKSKTMPTSVIETEKNLESAELPPPVIKKKPGPKSKTQKIQPSVAEEDTSEQAKESSQTQNKNLAAENVVSSFIPPEVDLFLKDASTRKRRRSLEKLIPDDSTEDLDTIITLSSRSSRAAKEKASAKLKTLMESNEGLSTRKKADVDSAKKDKDESEITKNNKEESDKSSTAQNKTVESNESKDGQTTSHIEEMHPPASKEGTSKNKDQNVFTCKTDMVEEDAKTIEADRLRKMEELNKSIGSRTSKLDFVDKLSNRLNKEQSGKNTGVSIKQEPKDNSDVTQPSRAKTPTMPVLEKETSLLQPVIKAPPLSKVSRTPMLSKKPVLDEDSPPPQSNVSFRQNKSNSLFSNMIEKLQGKINEAAVKQRPSVQSTGTSSNNVERSKSPEVLISIGDLIVASKKDSDILYSCHANDCYVATKDKMVFQLHCKFGHKDLNITSSLCDKCGVVIEATKDTSLLENLYDHLVFAHSDCLSKASTSLRMRRLSGDKLSVKQEQMEKLASTSTASKLPDQDFETPLDRHVLVVVSHSSKADTVTATTTVSSSSNKIPASVPEENLISAEISTPPTVSEEPAASEATLELAEDNPFSFKIENVMSLAETEPENQAGPLSPNQNNEKSQDLPPLKPVPPLTLIGPAKQPAVKQLNHLVVKEARLSATELSRPKKAPKALQKFIDTPGDLYKCPHFFCLFSTNVRTLLERHLKAHIKTNQDMKNMVACVYCDMKTPWEHVPMHIDIRHANSRFSCGHCLYRASLKEYVCLHIEHSHPDKQYLVLSLPQHRSAKKFSVADANDDCRTLCEPFRCVCSYSEDGKKQIKEYLFETEFATHLHSVHPNKMMSCGFNNCTAKIASSTMVSHWAVIHGISTYQCGQCKTSSFDIGRMYTHCAQFHQSTTPDILVRLNANKTKELGYTKEAFEKLGHVKKIPQKYLSNMAKKSQRFPKLLYISGTSSSEEPTSSSLGENITGTTSVTPLLPLTQGQQVKLGHVQPSKLLISNPNLQLVVASTTTGNEKVYLVPSPKISPNKGPTVMSVAPISKVVSQTSPAIKIVEGRAGKSVVAEEPISETTLPTVKPTEPITTVPSSSSHATIAVLSRSLPITLTSRSSRSLLKVTNPFCQPPSTTVSTFSNTLTSVAKPTVASAINPIPLSSTSNDAIFIPDIGDFAEPMGEETSSQDSSTGLSEDEILQSAIQSILDADDLSENSALSEALANESDNNTAITTSSSNNVASNIINDSIGDLSQLDPLSTAPPPLVLLADSPKQNETITLTSALRTSENMLQVEHVEVAGDASESSLLPEDVDPLNLDPLQSNEDSNPDAQSFDDINTGLDSPPEDPLTITPTFNSDLPSTDDQSSVDLPAAAMEPFEVPADVPADDSATETESSSQTLTDGNRTPMQITEMRRSTSMVSNSDDESDSSASEKGKKRGLIGYQLFRCAYCNLSFSNVHTFKSHVSSAPKCKLGPRQFQCVHCDKVLKTPQRLADHIQTHGVPRFACSLCNEKFATVSIVKLHMKNRHNIHHTNLVPLKSDRTNMETDAFMVKPAQANQPTMKEKEAQSESPKQTGDENTYNPDQVDSIPIRQIFNTNVKCGKCNYQTKVRVNIIRHLQMHLEEKAVPDSAPVNPVPCLEKNEKMFDKMINLAASSITTGRMGGPNQDKEKEDDHNPEFVPNHRRYVCAAQACSYLCPEEANLKHHLMALHSDDSGFNCAHCKKKIEPAEPEHVIKHLKLHGLHLYKCHYCTFVHHLKHKVEKHISDGHLDAAVKVVTVRSMESEPVEFGTAEEQMTTTTQQTSAAKFKPWRCCMCKAKCFTKEDIQSHTLHKHDMDTQYKCTLCAFKNDDQNSFRDHFKEKHSSHEIDIIYVYQKVEEELPKEDTNVTPFDTTPLWQRDKPRVRHIRGILFDESSPQPTKSPKKPAKSYSGPSAKASASTTPAASTSSASSPSKKTGSSSTSSAPSTPGTTPISSASKNLFDCIDAVARGTADTLQGKIQVAPSGAKEGSKSDKTDAGTRVRNDDVSKVATGDSEPASGASKEKVAAVNRKKDVVEEKSKSVEEKQPKKEIVEVDDAFDSGNDDVIEVKQVTSIIVIDSDSDTEPPKPEQNPVVTPKTKDKDSKSKPVAKNKGLKRQGTSDLLQEAVKMAKIEEPDDEDAVMATNCNKEHLIAMYGSFGSPHHKQWKCPKCHQFKSKRVADFMFHIYKDFNVYRYKCKACSDLSITYKYMLDHISLHPGFTEEIIEPMAQNVKLETWIHMVIREQSLVILKNSPLMKKRPLVGPTDITCYFCNEKFMSMPECCEHMLYHWVMMPYQCQYCPNEFYTVFDLKHHHKIEHCDLKLTLEPKGPTLSKAIQCIENVKKRPPPESTQEGTAQKKAKTDDGVKSTKGGTEGVLSGVVVNTPRRRREPKASSFTASPVVPDVIRIDDEDDLVIVTKTEEQVPNEDEVFACQACAHMSDTEALIIKHLEATHGIRTKKYHTLSKKKSEVASQFDMACNICDAVLPELNLRRHFLDTHLESHTFCPYRFRCDYCSKKYLTLPKLKVHFTRFHPGVTMKYYCAVKSRDKYALLSKNKLYTCTMCSYTNISPNCGSIRAHLRGHLRPVLCNHCGLRCRYHNELSVHHSKEHPELDVNFELLDDVQKEFAATLRSITQNAIHVGINDDGPVAKNVAKNVAKKSTSSPSVTSRVGSSEEAEYSYYGAPKETFDLSDIETTFELDGLEYTTTAEQMMKMFNLDPFVDVSDCELNILPLDKS